MSAPNVLLVMTDQHSAHLLGCAGTSHVATPYLDALAAQGTRVERAYTTFPLCVPARTSMMTGRFPHELGVHSNAPEADPPQVRRPGSLAAVMAGAGYRCGYAGKWHASAPSAGPGDGFDVVKDFGDEGLVEAAEAWLHAGTRDDRPFFLVASFDDPHTICEVARHQPSYYGDLPEVALADCPNLPPSFGHQPFEPEALRTEQALGAATYGTQGYTPDDWRGYRQHYADLVERADARVGRLLAVLDDLELAEDTLVVFTSDHGDGDGAHAWNGKSALFEEVVRVPLILRWPGHVPAGRVDATSLVSTGLDLLPTLADAAGVASADDGSGGRSLLTPLAGRGPLDRSHVVIETGFGPGARPRTGGRAVVENRYKYVVYGWGRHREQLYDLERDPHECVNLAVEASCAELLQHFRTVLLTWCHATDDSLFLKRLVLPDDVAPALRKEIYAVPY